MHIGFLIGQLAQGGAERQVYLLARELSVQGKKVTVITNHEGEFWHRFLIAGGVPVIVLPRKRSFDANRVWRLTQILISLRINVLFCFGSSEAFYGRVASLFISTATVVCLRNQDWGGLIEAFADRLLRPVTCFYTANSYVGVEYLKKKIGVNPRKVSLMPNAVDAKEIVKMGRELRDPRPDYVDSSAFWVGWIGTITWRKDPELLVETAAVVCREHKEVHFLVVGDGDLRPLLEHLIFKHRLQERVHVIGAVAQGGGIWRYVDCGLSTSRVEGTPNVLLEAMILGKPYVATSVGDFVHLIDHGKTGLLSVSREPGELGALVNRLILDEELRLKLSVAVVRKAKSFPSPAQMAHRYFILAQNLVASDIEV